MTAGPAPAPADCAALLTCPVCDAALTDDGRSLRCPAGHTFDRARQGYVDLLPTGHGRSGIRGDSAAMVQARRRFLEAGHYDPLARALEARAAAEAPRVVAEAGCGEGYYIGRLARRGGGCFFGFDVSTDALRLAARSHPSVRFLVNDINHRLCLADGAADLLLDCFAPRNAAEFARVLRPGGLLVVVIPEPDHLAELRSALPMLGIEPEKRERTVRQLEPAFALESEERVGFGLEVGGDVVADLVRMTPSGWHLPPAELERSARLPALEVTARVLVLAFRRA